jgi:heat shock protein HtpX
MGNAFVFEFWPLVVTIVLVWFGISWFSHTSMIRRLSHSHPVTRTEEPELYNLLENLCISQGVPMPRLEIIESHARNAFASGIDKKSYAITVTRGLLNSLTKDEVEAVLAHELTHILNRDVRLLIVSIIFTGMIGILAQMTWNSLRYMRFSGGRSRNSGAVILLIVVIALILSIGYMATLVTRFALSRGREEMADAGAIEMTKNPSAMMSALMRISKRERIPGATADIAMMYTHNSNPFLGLFATHPPIEERIRLISQLTNTPVPDIRPVPASNDISFGTTEKSPNPWARRRR